ncbi:MAG TPA: glycosyltransferase family 39 protein [Vicinamibacterales bacterium]
MRKSLPQSVGTVDHSWRLAAAILVLGGALRFVPIWFGLPYPQARPDEETAIGKALDALTGDPNPRFFHWPSLTFYLFAGVLHVASSVQRLAGGTGELTFTEQALVTRATVALAGTATILVVHMLTRRMAGPRVAAVAAAFLSVAILHVRESHFATADVLMTLLLWSSLLVLVDATTDGRAPRLREFAIAGGLAGLAATAKYNAAAVAGSMVAAQVLFFVREPGAMGTLRGWTPALVFGSSMVAAFLAGTPYAVLDFGTFARDLAFDFTHLSGGHRGIVLGRGWWYHATTSLPYGVGPPVFVAAIAGLVPFVRHYRAGAAILGAFAVPFYVVVGSGYTVFFRYMLPLVPMVCILAAIAVVRLADWTTRRVAIRREVVCAALLVLTLGPSLVQSAWFDLVLARTDTRVEAGRWLAARIQPDQSLYDAGSPYTALDLWNVRFARATFDEGTGSFHEGAPDWLVLHDSPLPAYTPVSPSLRALAEAEYVLAFRAHGIREGRRPGLYDQQDAFFVPFSRFWTVEAPGPTVSIYRRRE